MTKTRIPFIWLLDLQLFAEGGEGGDGAAAASTAESGVQNPAAGDDRLRELGVPESVLQKRANRAKRSGYRAPVQSAAPPAPKAEEPAASAPEEAPEQSQPNTDGKRMTWDEIVADPEYNKQMQSVIQARLKQSKGAEESLTKLQPAIELLARKYGLDAKNLDAEALTKAISDDDSYYEDKALEMGVSVETAKKLDQNERDLARRQEAEAKTIEEQRIQQHIDKLRMQGETLKQTFPNFDLATELRNPAFARMTSPNVGISVEDAYYAVHRREIQSAAMQVTAQKTAQQMANSIRAGQSRPVENGTSAQAPSTATFDYAHASKEQREAMKRDMRAKWARGEKVYPSDYRTR